ncbi:MAG: sulfotransferase [Pseudomonadota bacterium]
MAHPLSGANLGTLATVIGRSGLPSKAGPAAVIALAALARWPFSTGEKLLMESRLPSVDDMPAPVFILGHWRSGTTHLYNIMCQSGEWGFVPPVATGLPWDLFGLAKVFNPLLERALPEHRYIDNIPVTPESPQEDEIAIANMSEASFYHGIYFPRNFAENVRRGLFFDGCSPAEIRSWRKQFAYFLRKLYLHQGEKPLLIKNPVYTGRVAMLRKMFPGAKFIHIHRNPYDVFLSMRNFYQKLLGEFALQSYAHVDIDETILSVYDRMMRDCEADLEGVPAGQLVELGYDELDSEPMAALSRIYEGLALPNFESSQPAFEAYLASVKTFKKNKFAYSPEAASKVEARLQHYIKKWNYERPGEKAAAKQESAA